MISPTLLLCALAALSSAQITIDLEHSYQTASIVKKLNTVLNSTLVARDRSRVASMESAKGVPATAQNYFSSYTLPVTIGSDKRSYGLIVDTGASTLWAGAHSYRQFRTSKTTVKQKQQPFYEAYGSGYVDGVFYKDSVSIGGATATSQGIGGAVDAEGFCRDCHGSAWRASVGQADAAVLGFGPTALTTDIVPKVDKIPTLIDTLYAQKKIPHRMVGIDFRPTLGTDKSVRQNGVITLGGYDASKFVGKMTWLPHVPNKISSDYWNAAIDSFTYTAASKKSYQLSSSPSRRVGVVDSGTTLVLLPADVYGEYVFRVGGKVDSLGFLRIKSADVAKMGNLTLSMGGRKFVLTPGAQLFPPKIANRFGVTGSDAVSIFGSSGRVSSGLDFILGQMFLERYYAVFDSDKQQVGLAQTSDTFLVTYPGTNEVSPARTHLKAKAKHSKRLIR